MSKLGGVSGYVLLTTLLAVSSSAADKIYWHQSDFSGWRANLDGSMPERIEQIGGLIATSIVIDHQGGKVYWEGSGVTPRQNGIWRADLDGENPEFLLRTSCRTDGMAIDPVGRNLYWTERPPGCEGRVRRMDLVSFVPETLIEADFGEPSGLAVSSSTGAVYWLDSRRGEALHVGVVGTEPAVVTSFEPGSQSGMAVDEATGVVYWCSDGAVHRTLPGSTGEAVFITDPPCAGDMGIDPVERQLFWLAIPARNLITIERTALDGDGSDVQSVASCDDGGPRRLHVDLRERRVYWVCGSNAERRFRRADLDNVSEAADLFSLPGFSPTITDLVVDSEGGWIYWAEYDGGIKRSHFDGSSLEDVIIRVNPVWLDFDAGARMLYWTWPGGIGRMQVDSGQATDFFARKPSTPAGIAIDSANGVMYIGQQFGHPFFRANLDGSGVEPLVIGGISRIIDVKLSPTNGKLYWSSDRFSEIGRVNFDGTQLETLVTTSLPLDLAIDSARGVLYWSALTENRIVRSDLNGENQEVVLLSLLPAAIALSLDCGNFSVDPDETCDIAILPGEPGACPTSCDDGIICTSDELVGDGTCEAACVFTLIVDPINGDGCCPAGANANNDNDCEPVCGNNACEPSEDHRTCPNDCTTIPTTSAWGAGVLLLSLLIGAKTVFGRRRSSA